MSKYFVPEGFLLAFFAIVFLAVLFTYSGTGSAIGLVVTGGLGYFTYTRLKKRIG